MIPLPLAYEIIDAERTKVPGLEIRDDGATVILNDKQLSKGCQACKTGAWICIYIGPNCNLSCDYCPQDDSRHTTKKDRVWVNGGNFSYADDVKLEDIDWIIEKNPQIKGISFSGGEPFMYFDRVVEWAKYLAKYPHIYKWIYTNGTLPTEAQFKTLAKIGVNEIRFDGAATEYSDKTIEKIKLARKYFEFICVETPALPWLTDKLHSFLSQLKNELDYLNLHTLQINRQLNWPRLLRNHSELNDALTYKDSRSGREESLQSLLETYKTIRHIQENKLDIIVNDCGNLNMANQSAGWFFQRNNCNGCNEETWENFRERVKKDGGLP